MTHGTIYAYSQGCRCASCREAKNSKQRERRAKARAENRPSYQRELKAARERKEHYRGTCAKCGGPTSWASSVGKPKFCIDCSREERASAHGTPQRYNKGCRCNLCKEAHRVRMRKYYHERKARAQP